MPLTATKLSTRTRRTGRNGESHAGSQAVEKLRADFDRLLSDFLRGYWHVPFSRGAVDVEPYWRGDISFGATPAVDIVEKSDAYKVTAELPGVDEQHVEITFADGTLTIEGRKEEEPDDAAQKHFLSERHYGGFHRTFRVPDSVDADRIEARLGNGVLTIILPKTPEAQSKQKKIAVKRA